MSRLYLHVHSARGQQAVAPLEADPTVIGRGNDAAVRIVGDGVSRRHARLHRDPTGNWWISDLQSRNGTLVNGFAIDQRMIEVGDKIGIGSFEITVSDAPTASRLVSSRVSPRQAAGSVPERAPQRLGGYEILRELGRGGMGAVYLARQVSLNRRVAVKVMNPQWSANPVFLQRFTREAFAAAQLVHHNIVQIYDIGRHDNVSFFSMEYVEGLSLGDMLKTQGRIEPIECAGYILQAARGLKFAHDQGMIHRDIKPDNLMLNKEGVIKVADLGLVKSPGSDQAIRAAPESSASGSADVETTSVNEAMGTPAYMAPEQAVDAARVDRRADVYSLGCTFYKLVTGRPMFDARTADAMMDMHAEQQPVAPHDIAPDVPADLGAIILKMVEKNPADRHQNMAALIADLETFLAAAQPAAENDAPVDQDEPALREAAARFDRGAETTLRAIVFGLIGMAAACAIVFFLFDDRPWVAAGVVLGMVAAGACYFALCSADPRAEVAPRLRRYLFRRAWFWLLLLALLGGGGWLVYEHALYLGVIKFVTAGVVVALMLNLILDKWIDAVQRDAVEPAEQALLRMRRRGVGEEDVRRKVAEVGGRRWEAFYEQLFGYDAKMEARRRWGIDANGRPRPRCGAWRDPLMAMVDRRYRKQHRVAERAVLETVERDALLARGIELSQAADVANRAAETMMVNADEFRDKVEQSQPPPPPPPPEMAQVEPRDDPPPPAPDLVHNILGDVTDLPEMAEPAPQPQPQRSQHESVDDEPPALVDDDDHEIPTLAEPPPKKGQPAVGGNLEIIAEPSADIDVDVTLFEPGRLLQDEDEHTTHAKRIPIPFWALLLIVFLTVAVIIVGLLLAFVVF